MNQHKNKSLLLLLFVVLNAAGWLVSCKKDKTETFTKIELLSFGPTGAQPGDTIRFFGRNLNKVTEIQLTGAAVPQASFVSQTWEQILIVVPMSTEKGYVTLKTPEGDIVSKTEFNIEAPVTITSMTEEARPGENITIKGNLLNWVTSVTFSQDIAETTFVSQSLTELVVKVPVNAQTGKLILATGGTKPLTIETENELKVTLPLVTSLAPTPVLHATNLTITGTNLDLAQSVIFPGVAAPQTEFVSQSATAIVIKVPASATKGKITLAANSGVKTVSEAELVVQLPIITNLAPNPVAPNSDLTITGTDLNLVTNIEFTGIPAPVTDFVSQSPTQIVVKVPLGTLKGLISLSVLNSTLKVQSPSVLDILGGLPPLADFPLSIYTDQFDNGFQDWSWAARDIASTAVVRQGDKSIKATYGSGGYEGITFHYGNDAGLSLAGYSKFEFSLFAEASLAGKKMNIVINGGWGTPYVVTLVGGEWTTYSINLSDLSGADPIKDIVLQSAGFAGVVHIDHVGLR